MTLRSFLYGLLRSVQDTWKLINRMKRKADDIKHRVADSHLAQVSDFLTVIKSINKTDVVTLISNFKSLKAIANASLEELALCPGLGPKKVRNLYEAFHGDIFTSTKLRK